MFYFNSSILFNKNTSIWVKPANLKENKTQSVLIKVGMGNNYKIN